ncbi:PTS sugar transporter subunit IIA [Streptobacillus felis]|uniref:PTS sugar transporter subunit IIA n=1 Tax=Streptobacillus felis TaxID=1384509 RepID=A0A7Z0T7V8_9FUSO|nr:PTS sugar transporter subunit IIA [Streptobacillus felis]NYV27214.1 PTS sugar transporter subunit IIA [Streptobacillus felis]
MKTNYIFEKIYVDGINLNLQAKNKNALLKEMFKGLENNENIINKEKAFEDLLEREVLGTTGIGRGVAIPHAKTDAVKDIIITVGVVKDGIEYEAVDEEKVNTLFMFLSPVELSREYLTILAKISRFCQSENFRKKLLECESKEELIDLIKSMEV